MDVGLITLAIKPTWIQVLPTKGKMNMFIFMLNYYLVLVIQNFIFILFL